MWMRKDRWAQWDEEHKRFWDEQFRRLREWSLWWPK